METNTMERAGAVGTSMQGPAFNELEAARARVAALEAEQESSSQRIAELEEALVRSRTEQIVEGTDERLVGFLERAAEIADDLDLCSDYDRVLEELGAPPRKREWMVDHYVTVSFTLSLSVTAPTEVEAEAEAEALLTRDRVVDELNNRADSIFIETELESTTRA